MEHLNYDAIGIKDSPEAFVAFLDGIRGGQFFHVKGYLNQHNEIADYWLRFGINYANLKARDIFTLQNVNFGRSSFTLHVKHGVWVDNELLHVNALSSPNASAVMATVKFTQTIGGVTCPVEITCGIDLTSDIFGNRKANGRTAVTLSYDLPSTHPAVLAVIGSPFGETQGTLLQSLINPRQTTADYEKEGKSCYTLPPQLDGKTRWYIRDVLFVHKDIRQHGDYPFKASLPLIAVKDAISSQILLTGKYRQFILTEGQFEAIAIEGQIVLCDNVEDGFYFALPETYKTAMEASVASVA